MGAEEGEVGEAVGDEAASAEEEPSPSGEKVPFDLAARRNKRRVLHVPRHGETHVVLKAGGACE